MMDLSVIIPVYNTEQGLRACLDSVLASGYRDFEVILVDDGSTDGSGELCDWYAGRDQTEARRSAGNMPEGISGSG